VLVATLTRPGIQEGSAGMSSWPSGIGAITLFVEDLETSKQFYRDVFGLPVAFEDDNSAVFNFGNRRITHGVHHRSG
jgi:catechol-2,3-dioxygenase